jgi:hypothetical protein
MTPVRLIYDISQGPGTCHETPITSILTPYFYVSFYCHDCRNPGYIVLYLAFMAKQLLDNAYKCHNVAIKSLS